MAGLRLLSLGVGDAFSARWYSSCFALESEGRWLLIDCPHPIRKILHEAAGTAGLDLDLPNFDGVVLTHLHGDHASGLEGAGFYARFVMNRTLPVVTHPEVAADLWKGHLAGSMEWSLQEVGSPPVRRTMDEFFDVQTLAEGEVRELGPFRIRCRKTIHNIPTIALRIEAGGRTLGYSADTAFEPALVQWLASADLVVHEASGGFMHTAYADLAALPAPLRAKMRLIHCPDNFEGDVSVIEPLRQGRIYEV